MRTLILAATALAFLSATAFAQDKAASPAPAAQSGDMSKGDATKMAPKKKKTKKAAKKPSATTTDDATKQ
jgi:hypothetical protein